mgnify:FL=1
MSRHALGLAIALIIAFPDAGSAQSTNPSSVPTPSLDQLLIPGDMIRLRIWREPDLSGDFIVDENGVVVFPKIGPFVVTNHSPETLRAHLLSAYRVYLRNPSIDIMPLRRVNILGAVRNPGLYPVDPTMTLADAVALAGGAMPHGDPDKIELIRNGHRLTTRLGQLTRIGDLPIRSGDQIFIPERSWVSRNQGLIAAGLSAGVSLFIALFLR